MTIDPQDPAVKNSGMARNIQYVKAVGFPVIDRDTFLCGCVAKFVTIFSLLQFHIRLIILDLTTIEFLEITSGNARRWRNGKRIETNATLKILRIIGEFFAGLFTKAKKEGADVAVTTAVSGTAAVVVGSQNEQQHHRERMEKESDVDDKDDYQSDLDDFDSIEGGSVAVVVASDVGNLSPNAAVQSTDVERGGSNNAGREENLPIN
ncbi:UNVERIFIED_CONTAM: hypothetical protein HDU68_007578 [Siphonaria sp. JEL0065]|nr:hypothetical protein HDU68_007578 [Siphonaria sp. JEL0065]